MNFCFEQAVPLAPERVFAFFENPERLELLHAGWSKIRLLHHENRVRIGGETWIELTVAGFVPMVLGFRHILFEQGSRFGEVAIHGPFSRFIHIHEFEGRGGSTLVRDLLEVCWPRHYVGEAVMRRVVVPAIRRMFQNRAEALTRFADDGTIARCSPGPTPAPER